MVNVRILLASAPHLDTFGYSMPPPGLLRLGGALEAAHLDVELVDLAHELACGRVSGGDDLARSSADLLLARGPSDLIGVSVMGATLPIALAILELVRERAPQACLVVGGPGTTGIDRAILERFAWIDVVVRGEGEITLVELARARATGSDARSVLGTTSRSDDGQIVRAEDRPQIADLARLPAYAWHLLPPIHAYKAVTGAADGLVALDSGRGCVFDCSFCTIGRFWSRRSRVLPARCIVDEMEALRTMPGATSAYLCHDIFGANRGHALAVCEEIERRGIRVAWEARARVDHLDDELLERMARAGCWRVLLGIESADARVLERCHKGLRDGVDVLATVDSCARVGITPILSLILGLPGEDDGALRASLDLCAAALVRAGVNLSLHLPNPQPGCGLGEEFGALARPIDGVPPDMALGTGTTRAERALIGAHPDLFSTFALLPGDESHLRELHALARELPEVLMRYPRTFALLARDAGLDTLDLWRAWRARGRSFEAFARSRADTLVDDCLALESMFVRVAGGALASPSPSSTIVRGPRAAARFVHARHDLARILAQLRVNGPIQRDGSPTTFALTARPGAQGIGVTKVEILRVGHDAAAICEALDGEASLDELDAARPGLARALDILSGAGLVHLGPARASTLEPA